MIREVHVYGPAQALGERDDERAQHTGLGSRLLQKAHEIAAGEGYSRLAVISAIGTKPYYRRRGFSDGSLYQIKDI